MGQYSVLIVEDDQQVRQRLVDVVKQCPQLLFLDAKPNFVEGKQALLDLHPDILLTDLGLPDGSGIDIIKAIYHNQLDCEAMVISGFQDEHTVFQALEAGATAYILKHNQNNKITDEILAMMQGGAPISPVIARLMLKKFQHHTDLQHALPEALTERQVKILKLVSQGFSSQEIAEKLSISYYTVTTHIKNIYGKLQVNSRTEAIHEATRLGLL